jgi:hypothetical protein
MATQQNVQIEKRPTNLHHVYLIDWNDDGILKEIAVVLEAQDGSIYGIEVDKLHMIDKSRLKKFLVSVHADKYKLWELLSQGHLDNGMNALDFFHSNYVKVKRPRGAVVGGGLASVDVYKDFKVIGSDFVDTQGGTIASEAPSVLGKV